MRPLVDPATLSSLAPGAIAVAFMAGLLVALPLAVMAQEHQLRAMGSGFTLTRRDIYVAAVTTHLVLLAAALLAARDAGIPLIGATAIGAREMAVGAAAIALGMLTLSERLAPGDAARERAEAIAPRTPREMLAFTAIAFSAGIAEEIAYRGVLFTLLAHWLGGWWVPAIVAAAAFGVAHVFQGWRAAALATAAGLVAQLVVGLTGTLLVAIVVHIVHDVIAGAVIGRRARRRSPGGDPVAV